MERLPFAIPCMLALSACLRNDGAFPCEDDAQCGAGGQCEMSAHYCSFVDTSCPSGRRYGVFSGPEATHCVTVEPVEPFEPPQFAGEEHRSAANTNGLVYMFEVKPGDRRFLLVTVQVGALCADSSPERSSVTFSGQRLEFIKEIRGTAKCETATRSEQWGLIEPPIGEYPVVVMMKDNFNTMHSAALSFTGVNQIKPVRSSAIASGDIGNPGVTVSSATGDLVVNTVGYGGGTMDGHQGGILGPVRCDKLFVYNVSHSSTLDNSAACTAPGATEVTITWEVDGEDEWQTISSSLQP